MKYQHFENIVSHIKHDVPCPKCKKAVLNSSFEIVSTNKNQAEFQIQCKHCGSKIKIIAQLSESLPQAGLPKIQKLVPLGLAKELAKLMKNFKGQDVNELFKK